MSEANMWIIFSLVSYFFLAVAAIFDRLLLVGSSASPRLYAFYVGAAVGIIGLALLPFVGFLPPSFPIFARAVATSIAWMAFLVFLFESTFQAGISRAAPMLGGFTPIFTFFIGFLFFGREVLLAPPAAASFALFIIAGILLSRSERDVLTAFSFSFRLLLLLGATAFFFALYLILLKVVFKELSFLEGFVWTRAGVVFILPFFLLFGDVRRGMFQKGHLIDKRFLIPFAGAQTAGPLGVLFQQLSLFFADANRVAFIPALIGVQYIFLYAIMIALYRWKPEWLKEVMGGRMLYQKIFATLLVIAGLAMLALTNGGK